MASFITGCLDLKVYMMAILTIWICNGYFSYTDTWCYFRLQECMLICWLDEVGVKTKTSDAWQTNKDELSNVFTQFVPHASTGLPWLLFHYYFVMFSLNKLILTFSTIVFAKEDHRFDSLLEQEIDRHCNHLLVPLCPSVMTLLPSSLTKWVGIVKDLILFQSSLNG